MVQTWRVITSGATPPPLGMEDILGRRSLEGGRVEWIVRGTALIGLLPTLLPNSVLSVHLVSRQYEDFPRPASAPPEGFRA